MTQQGIDCQAVEQARGADTHVMSDAIKQALRGVATVTPSDVYLAYGGDLNAIAIGLAGENATKQRIKNQRDAFVKQLKGTRNVGSKVQQRFKLMTPIGRGIRIDFSGCMRFSNTLGFRRGSVSISGDNVNQFFREGINDNTQAWAYVTGLYLSGSQLFYPDYQMTWLANAQVSIALQ